MVLVLCLGGSYKCVPLVEFCSCCIGANPELGWAGLSRAGQGRATCYKRLPKR